MTEENKSFSIKKNFQIFKNIWKFSLSLEKRIKL